MKLVESFMLMEVNSEYRKYKPLTSATTDPKAWYFIIGT